MKNSTTIKRLLTISIAGTFIGSTFVPASAADLNLGSAAPTVPTSAQARPVAINVGGNVRLVQPGANLTPAEHMAVQQVMHTGTQQLGLDAAGRAVSGRVILDGIVPGGLNSLVIPQGVTAINNFANTSGLMNVLGNLVNSGNFYAVSTDRAVANAAISATNIINNKGALLTSLLPANGLIGYANAIKDLSLSLNASKGIVNKGTISSAADLTVTAGGAITNSGLLKAAGDVNIGSTTGGAVKFNGANGTVKAGNAINVGDLNGTTAVDLNGGAWQSQQLNINTAGLLNAHLGEVTGVVNMHTNGAHFSANTADLKLGNVCVNGDPYYANTGDITITSAMNITTNGYPFMVVAGGNINTSDAGSLDINTSSALSFGGGDVTLIAGAAYTEDPNPQDISQPGVSGFYHAITVTGPSLTGGSIRLDDRSGTGGGAGVRNIDTRGLGPIQPDSGDVTLIAYSDLFGLNNNSGNVIMRQDGQINMSAQSQASNGDLLVIAGSHQTNALPAVQLPDVFANGGTIGGGSILIVSDDPGISGGSVVFDGDGQRVSGGFYPTHSERTLEPGEDTFAPLHGNMNLKSLNGAGQNAPDVVTAGFIVLDGSSNSGAAITWSATPSQISNGTVLSKLRDNVTNLIGSQILVTGDIVVPDSHLVVKTTDAGVTFNGFAVAAGAIDINAQGSGSVGGTSSIAGGVVTNGSGVYVDKPGSPGQNKYTGGVNVTAGGAITSPSIGTLNGDVNLTAASIGTVDNPVRVVVQGSEGSILEDLHDARLTTETTGSTYLTADSDINFYLPYSSVGNNSTFKLTTTNSADIQLVGGLLFDYLAPATGKPLGGHDVHLISAANILFSDFNFIYADTVELSAVNGAIIGNGTGGFGSLGDQLAVNATSLVVSSKGDAQVTGVTGITSAPSPTISIRTTLGPNANFNFVTSAVYNGAPIGADIATTNLGPGAKFAVTAGNTINVNQIITGGDGAEVSLTTTSGPVVVKDNINMGSGGKVTLNSGAGISIQNGADILFGGGGSIDLTSKGAIDVQPGSTLGAESVSFDAPGFDVGSGTNGFATVKTSNLTVYHAHDAYIYAQSYPFTFGSGSMHSLNLFADANVTINSLNANTARVESQNGSITASGVTLDTALDSPARLDLIANNGAVSITGSVHSDDYINITAPDVHNNGNISATANGLAQIFVGPIESASQININGVPGRQLTLDGTGTMTANNVTIALPPNSVLNTNTITIGGAQTINGEARIIANGDSQSQITFEPGSTFSVNGPLTTFATTQYIGGSVNSKATRLVMPNGKGVVANPDGDLNLTSNFKVAGHSVAFLAKGNIVAPSTVTMIDTSNATGQGGSITLVAGYNFTKSPNTPTHETVAGNQSDIGNLYTITGPSDIGGSILLPSVSFKTNSTLATAKSTEPDHRVGGDFVAVAHAGSLNAGVISLKDVTTGIGTTTKGGDVTIIGQGGVAVDDVNTGGAFAGNVNIQGAVPDIAGGTMVFQDGYNRTGAKFVALPITNNHAGAAVTIGSIYAGATSGQGANVSVHSDSTVSVLRDVTAFGQNGNASGDSAGGHVWVSSTNGNVFLDDVSVSAGNIVSATSLANGGRAGTIVISSPKLMQVAKNLLAVGGNATKGTAGGGGFIALRSSRADADDNLLGEVRVGGFINANGGNGTVGGDGGFVWLAGSRVLVLGKSGTNSILAQEGTSKNTTFGEHGSVAISTYAVQPMVQLFDMSLATKTGNPGEIALPGGIFASNVAGTTNGTTGGIITGQIKKNEPFPGIQTKIVTDTVAGGSEIQTNNVNVNVTGGTVTIKEFTPTGEPVFDAIGVGVKVSPAIAMALYQKTHGMEQTIFPDSVTEAATDRNVSGQAGGHGFVTINADDIYLPFTSFKTGGGTAGTHINVVVNGSHPFLDLSQAKTVAINGLLQFDPGSFATIDFGKAASPLVAPTSTSVGGSISGADRLNILTDATTFSNAGEMYANSFTVLPTATTFTFNNLATGVLKSLNTGGTAPAYNVSAVGSLPTLKINNLGGKFEYLENGNTFTLPIVFANDQYPLSAGVNALQTLPFNVTRNVNLTVAMANKDATGAWTTGDAQEATIVGSLTGSTISVASSTVATSNTPTRLVFLGATLDSRGGVTVKSSGGIQAVNSRFWAGTNTGEYKALPANTFKINAVTDILSIGSGFEAMYGGEIKSTTGGVRMILGFGGAGTGQHNDIFSHNGAVLIQAKKDVTMPSNGYVSACAGLKIISDDQNVNLNGTIVNNSKTLEVHAPGLISVNAKLASGYVYQTIPGTIAKGTPGGKGDIKIDSGAKGTSTSSIFLSTNASITSNLGNVTIDSDGAMGGLGKWSVTANGGNVAISGAKGINFTQYAIGAVNPTITATAYGDTKSSVGGLVELSSGPGVVHSLKAPVATASDLDGIGVNNSLVHLTSSGVGGNVRVNANNSNGLINLVTGAHGAANLQTNGGGIIFNSFIDKKDATSPSGKIEFDGVNINTYGFKPIGHMTKFAENVDFVVDTEVDI